MDETLLSSPDPLGDSSIFISPPKPRTSKARSSLGTSPKKQTFELDVGNELSPQKIRVTVEAGEDRDNLFTHHVDRGAVSPTPSRRPVGRRERTTTTTIPLKGLSDTENEQEVATPKRGRGRPRKTPGKPVATKKTGRAGTPVKRGAGRRKSINGFEDEDDDANTPRSTEDGRKRGRPRSVSAKRKSITAGDSSISKPNKRGRKKSLVPKEVFVPRDEPANDDEQVEEDAPEGFTELISTIDRSIPTSPSTYSTIRSTTTAADEFIEEPDVILAVFDPQDATPRKTGWSSPRAADGSRLSSSVRRRSEHRSLSISSEDSEPNSLGAQSITELSPEHDAESLNVSENNDQVYQHQEQEEDDLPEFDTIMESEGFSMISVDSVPSLRKHLNSPAFQMDPSAAVAPRHKSLLSIREDAQNDTFSSIPADVFDAATPARSASNQRLLSVQPSQHDDSFSSIPSDILEAATPAPAPQTKNFFPVRTNRNSDGDSQMTSTTKQKSHGSRLFSYNSNVESSNPSIPSDRVGSPEAVGSNHGSHTSQDAATKTFKESFSNILSPSLDEEPPRQDYQSSFASGSKSQHTIAVNGNSPSLIRYSISSATPVRLPTPDDTPSPVAELAISADNALGVEIDHIPQDIGATGQDRTEPMLDHSQMRSSPPSAAPRRYTSVNELGPRSSLYPDLNVTPLQFSSPSLPPALPVQQPLQFNDLKSSPRPTLSPVARTGRALQDLVIPSSPRSRAQSLGSPFKSPMERKSSTVSLESQKEFEFREESRAKPLPRLDLERHLFSNHAVRQALGGYAIENSPSQKSRSSSHSKSPGSSQNEDPFGNSATRQSRSPSPAERQAYSLEIPTSHRRSDSHNPKADLQKISGQIEDAMSWQADSSIREGHPTGLHSRPSAVTDYKRPWRSNQTQQHHSTTEHAIDRQQTKQPGSSYDNLPRPDAGNRFNDNSRGTTADNDEDYSLLLETINSSSPHAPQQPEARKSDTTEKPRRSKLPSPWRKNSRRLIYSDELSQLPSPEWISAKARDTTRSSELEPLTTKRVIQHSNVISIPQKSNFAPRVRSAGNLDLSALLASPAKDLPILPTESSGTSKYNEQPSKGHHELEPSTTAENYDADEATPTQESFMPIPQKIGFKPRVRSIGNIDLSALLNSPPKKLPTLSSHSQTGNNSRQHIALPTSSGLSSQAQSSESSDAIAESRSSPEMSFAPVPQKVGFKPYVRGSGDIAILEKLTTSISKPSTTKERNERSPRSWSIEQSSTATAPFALAGSDKLNSGSIAHDTPEVSSSPAFDESPGTPSGKENQSVYTRTSEWRANVHPVFPETGSQSPTKSILRSPVKQLCQETPGKMVAWVSSSPTPSEGAEPLSATEWTRDHWLLLTEILDNWRPSGWTRDPTCPKVPPTTPSKRRRSFNETRVVSKLLGKVVTSQGERMRLEQWHLEAVDEWREEVPGWDEVAIAIRLFSLIIGSERRANGTANLRNEMRARGEDPDAEWKAKAKAQEKERRRIKA
ncbi:hypothetical protein PVAG01_01682 [Phlyctema vagabunda]|uniref:Uncharacterized protein n=1 Tax=Phlyctema vagabunda TaxID=108571 RepID=A0ABR4PXS6_9HELO